MRKILFIPICLMLVHLSAFAAPKAAKFLNRYQFELRPDELLVFTPSSTHQTGLILGKKTETMILAKDYVPQSINSAKIRAKEDGVSPNAVRILRWKDRALFYYETAEHVRVYSTIGGTLLISKKGKRFDATRLSLLTTPNRKVAGQ